MNDRAIEMEKFLKEMAEKMKTTKYMEMNDIYDSLESYGLSSEDIQYSDKDLDFIQDGAFEFSPKKLAFIKSKSNAPNYSNKTQRFQRLEQQGVDSVEINEELKKMQNNGQMYEKNGDRWIKLVLFNEIKSLSVNRDEHFMYFLHSSENLTNESGLKMYIPLGKEGVLKLSPKLILLLNGEYGKDIPNSSKIADKIRTDDFVVRVNSKEDAKYVADFIEKGKFDDGTDFSSVLISLNPFLISENGLGYASDRDLSYNANVASYIFKYMSQLKENGSLDEVSLEGFREFLQKERDNIFVNGEGLEEYIKNEFDAEDNNHELWLMNKMEVMDLIIKSLDPEATIEDVYTHFEDINNEEYRRALKEYFENLLKGKKLEMPKKPSELKEKNIEEEKIEPEEAENAEKTYTYDELYDDYFDENGYNKEGYDRYGFNKDGLNEEGKTPEEVQKEYDALAKAEEIHDLGYDPDTVSIDGYDPDENGEPLEEHKESSGIDDTKENEVETFKDMSDLTVEELQQMINDNSFTNEEQLKQALVQLIIKQQAIIENQRGIIDRQNEEIYSLTHQKEV